MKTLHLSATLMLLGTLTLGTAATIDEQIATIQTATPEERVTLVNEFKTTLSTLSIEERAAAVDKLRSSMQERGLQNQSQTQTKTRTQTQNRERDHSNQGQVDGEMLRNQKMNQNHAGSQAMGQGVISTHATDGAPIGGNTQNHFMGKR